MLFTDKVFEVVRQSKLSLQPPLPRHFAISKQHEAALFPQERFVWKPFVLLSGDVTSGFLQGELFHWSPVFNSEKPCELHCKSDGKFFSVMLRDTVVDGTPCQPGSRDVCINGKCRVSCIPPSLASGCDDLMPFEL